MLRENGLALSMAAALIGLALGRLFHDFIIAGVLVDGMTFPDYISPLSLHARLRSDRGFRASGERCHEEAYQGDRYGRVTKGSGDNVISI